MLKHAKLLHVMVTSLETSRLERARMHTFIEQANVCEDCPDKLTPESMRRFRLRSPKVTKALPQELSQIYGLLVTKQRLRLISYDTHPSADYITHQSDSKHLRSCMTSGLTSSHEGEYYRSYIHSDISDYNKGHLHLVVVGNSWHEDSEGYLTRAKLRTVYASKTDSRIIGFALDRVYGQTHLISSQLNELKYMLQVKYGNVELFTQARVSSSNNQYGWIHANGYNDTHYWTDLKEGQTKHEIAQHKLEYFDPLEFYAARNKVGTVYDTPFKSTVGVSYCNGELSTYIKYVRQSDEERPKELDDAYFLMNSFSYAYVDNKTEVMRSIMTTLKSLGIKVIRYKNCYFTPRDTSKSFVNVAFDNNYEWCITLSDMQLTPNSLVVTRTNLDKGLYAAVGLNKKPTPDSARHCRKAQSVLDNVMPDNGIDLSAIYQGVNGTEDKSIRYIYVYRNIAASSSLKTHLFEYTQEDGYPDILTVVNDDYENGFFRAVNSNKPKEAVLNAFQHQLDFLVSVYGDTGVVSLTYRQQTLPFDNAYVYLSYRSNGYVVETQYITMFYDELEPSKSRVNVDQDCPELELWRAIPLNKRPADC